MHVPAYASSYDAASLLWDAQLVSGQAVAAQARLTPTFPLMVFRRVITVRTCALYASRADCEVKKASWFVLPPVYANLRACAPQVKNIVQIQFLTHRASRALCDVQLGHHIQP